MQFSTNVLKNTESVIQQLACSSECVSGAIPFFSDRYLFDALVMCRRRGIRVSIAILDNRGNRQAPIAWERLTALGGEVHWVSESAWGGGEWGSYFLIDRDAVITIGFNGEKTVSSDGVDPILVHKDAEFSAQMQQAFWRLINQQVEFKVKASDLSLVEDPDAEELGLKTRILEARVLSMESEIAEINRKIHVFDIHREKSIGDLIRRFLDVKRQYLHCVSRLSNQAEALRQADEAENMYRQYKQAQDAKAEVPELVELSPEQQQELKSLYRKLAMQCHPDRVEDALKANAKTFFQQLQTTYQNNDLVNLKNLKLQIEQGLGELKNNELLSETERVRKKLTALQRTMARLRQQHASLIQSSVWREINIHPDWNIWMDEQAEQLQAELQKYMSKLARAQNEIKACTP